MRQTLYTYGHLRPTDLHAESRDPKRARTLIASGRWTPRSISCLSLRMITAPSPVLAYTGRGEFATAIRSMMLLHLRQLPLTPLIQRSLLPRNHKRLRLKSLKETGREFKKASGLARLVYPAAKHFTPLYNRHLMPSQLDNTRTPQSAISPGRTDKAVEASLPSARVGQACL